jgi:dihydroorotase
MKLVIRSAKIIDPQSKFNQKKMDVLIDNGTITSIQKEIKVASGTKEIKGTNLHLSPGLFDLHVNFRDPGFEMKEDLNSGMNAATKGGFTGVLLMPTNTPSTDNKVQVEYLLNNTKGKMLEVIPSGSITENNKGKEMTQMFEMHQSGAKSFTDDKNSVQHAGMMKLALQYTKTFGGLVMNQPNDTSISGDGKMNEGEISIQMGLKGIPALAEEIMLSRDIELAEYTGGKIHASCISTAKSVDMLRKAKKKGVKITADVAIHNLILDDSHCADFDSLYKVFPPLREKTDIKALIKGLKDGTIDAICSDHTPDDVENKNREFDNASFGIIGLQTAFSLACQLEKDLTLETIISKLSIEPRKVLGLKTAKVDENEKANFFCYQAGKNWSLEMKDIVSKSKNTPFINQDLSNQIMGVVYGNKSTF